MRIIMTIVVDINQEKYAIDARPNHTTPEDVYFDILESINRDIEGVGSVITSSYIEVLEENIEKEIREDGHNKID